MVRPPYPPPPPPHTVSARVENNVTRGIRRARVLCWSLVGNICTCVFLNFPRLHLGYAECTQGSVSARKTDLADDLFPTFLYMSSLGRCSVSEVAGTNSRNKGIPVEGPIQRRGCAQKLRQL